MPADDTLIFDYHKAIIDRFTANWTTLPAILENDDGEGLTISSGFVKISFFTANSDFATINAGNPKIRTTGIVIFEIFTPQNEEIGDGLTYAGQIATIFRGKTFSGVSCFSPRIENGKEISYSKSKYWITPLLCPFRYDKYITIL
ncbi:MAG: hypothetical protein A2Y53_05670 [Chloroflexi bacterium RBG_16_47_49]|nr:MAG: hypothetical protein A2Y53_05670 [Chloroflexi bacterium RBG_16_47_49]